MIREKFSTASNFVTNKAITLYLAVNPGFKPTSCASKIAKAVIISFLFLTITAEPVFATAFLNQASTWIGGLVMLIGGGLAVYGVVNLAEGYGNDNPGAKSQGMKQLMAGGALGLIGLALPTALQAIISEAGIS